MPNRMTGSNLLRHCFLALALLASGLGAGSHPALAEEAPPAKAPTAEVRLFLELLQDPVVQDWLGRQPLEPATDAPATPAPEQSAGAMLGERVAALRAHLAVLAKSVPLLGPNLASAAFLFSLEFEERGLIGVLLLFLAFIGAGYGAEWLFWRATKSVREWIIGVPITTAATRLKATTIRLAFGVGWVTAFALGSVGAFLVFDWPLLLREIVLGYLVAFLGLRLTIVAGRFFLAPGAERYRIIPMSKAAALFWHRRLASAIGFYLFARVTLGILKTLGLSAASVQLLAYGLGLVLLAMGVEAAWRRPIVDSGIPRGDAQRRFGDRAWNWLASGLFVLLWLLWAGQFMAVFWLVVVATGLPLAQFLTRQSVSHLLRPGEEEATGRRPPTFAAICLERGLRALFIIGAALLLADAWEIDLVGLTARDTIGTRLVRGALSAVVIVLVANFLWHVAKGMIDAKVVEASDPNQVDAESQRKRARLRTLLPILRNVLFVIVLAVAAMMVLSSLGLEIGPLIAGAGVVGVAVGFGAQTLVRDIFSGVFYLLDDAFRVGEYIQSGSYKGTVESFSLRSVKLRHHRGPLYTVPFGELGAVQNMSRDWVIDKMMIGITYDSNLDTAKKLIKQIGKDLAADPEFGPNILEPLKMQGVEQFGDYAIQIRMKMMTRPGEQFPIRRKAFALIKKAFDENGIKFAFPTVQVAGGEDAAGAAARQAIDVADKAAAQPT